MIDPKRKVFLIRHGETAWSLSGQHTGRTDIPLTEEGLRQASCLAKRLKGHTFEKVFTSPLKRAYATCEKAGLAKGSQIDPDLVEWDYGDYEGLKSQEICKGSPNWNLFLQGPPHGESLEEIAARAQKVLMKIESSGADVALFSHGHFLRVLTTQWLDLPLSCGNLFLLSPASISILTTEKGYRVIQSWNDTSHLFT
ncbi:MAG: histidine phosphatase family protein [Chlamydiales bacterium]|nr:histidine phosphatase family protein [Chlamydiales bacterium]